MAEKYYELEVELEVKATGDRSKRVQCVVKDYTDRSEMINTIADQYKFNMEKYNITNYVILGTNWK